MNETLFRERLQAAGLSRWELGDLLGIHPHHLHDPHLNQLSRRPIWAIIELARHLDLHPADLVPELRAVLDIHPAPGRVPADDPSRSDADAAIVVNALAHAAPKALSAEHLAGALSWSLARTHDALTYALAHPQVGGPMAVRRVPPHRFTLAPRTDVLSADQHRAVRATGQAQAGLTGHQAVVLLTALACGHTPTYAEYRDQPGWREAESALKCAGLLSSDLDPSRVDVADDVLYSLRYHHDDDLPARTPPGTRDST